MEIITDGFLFNDYLNFIRLLKPNEYINNKLKKAIYTTPKYKTIYDNFYKISLINQLKEMVNINKFDIKYKEIDEPLNTTKKDDELFKKIKISFRCSTAPPKTYNTFIKYYIHKITHILGNIKLIKSVQTRQGGPKYRKYNIDDEKFNKYIKLYQMSDPDRHEIEKLNI